MTRFWITRLESEYDQICYQYRLVIKRPLIQILPLAGRWAEWDPMARTITFSERLIGNYSWEAVLEILKHEMAHQYCHEFLGEDDAHGPNFKKACEKLGVAPWARRAESETIPPQERPTAATIDTATQKIFSRVEKLLSLANSSNEFEAISAMQKVQELYQKYNLDRLQFHQSSELTYLTLKLGKKRVERYQSLIGSILAEHFFVQVIHTTSFNANTGEEERALELLGTYENVLMGEYVFGFLTGQLKQLWKKYKKDEGGFGGRARNSYYLGVLHGFREKLEQSEKVNTLRWAQEANTSASTALALVKSADEELTRFVRSRYPRLVNISRGRRRADMSSYNAGIEAGKKIILRKAVTNESGFLGRLLGR